MDASALRADRLAYASCYCEENALRLADRLPSELAESAHLVFITNPSKTVLVVHQRSSPHGGPDEPPGPIESDHVVWDYHVVLVTTAPRPLVWDLDTRLPFPVPLDAYLGAAFVPIDPRYGAMFRVVPASLCRETLASDRRHMLADGKFLAPPPAWPCLGQGKDGSEPGAATSGGEAAPGARSAAPLAPAASSGWAASGAPAVEAASASGQDAGAKGEDVPLRASAAIAIAASARASATEGARWSADGGGARHSLPCFLDVTQDVMEGGDAAEALRDPDLGSSYPFGVVVSRPADLLDALSPPAPA